MRTRKEIEDIVKESEETFQFNNESRMKNYALLSLEVLLDIRDLLNK